jgi:hypothetical protein
MTDLHKYTTETLALRIRNQKYLVLKGQFDKYWYNQHALQTKANT